MTSYGRLDPTVLSSVALRLDLGKLGKNINELDVSADMHYIAVATNGELVVVDLQRWAVATLMIAPSIIQRVSFFDPRSIAFNEPGVLGTLHVDTLDYVEFQPASEPQNSVTF